MELPGLGNRIWAVIVCTSRSKITHVCSSSSSIIAGLLDDGPRCIVVCGGGEAVSACPGSVEVAPVSHAEGGFRRGQRCLLLSLLLREGSFGTRCFFHLADSLPILELVSQPLQRLLRQTGLHDVGGPDRGGCRGAGLFLSSLSILRSILVHLWLVFFESVLQVKRKVEAGSVSTIEKRVR